MESNEILTLRAMAWQRAKGELHAMLATYQPASGSVGGGGPEQSEAQLQGMADRVKAFIDDIESTLLP